MECVVAAIGTLLSCACNKMNTSLEEKYKYMKSSKEEFQTLKDKRTELIAQVDDVNAKLLIAEGEGKTRTKIVETWLNKANRVKSEVNVVQTKAEVPNRCLCGVLPNCCSRAKLGKQMLKLIEEMTNLLNADQVPEEALAISVPEMVGEIPTTRLIGKTAEKNFEMVWDWLIGDQFQKIGVYGMGGAGKTTSMKNINDRLRLQQQRRFESVLWVTVSKDVNTRKLQEQIAGVVNNLDQKTLETFARQDEVGRSSILLSALRRKGKFVLILDDIWEPFDLQELGVPEPSKDNGCKIVLTTRSLEVCRGMLCQKDVKVEPLSKDEAWELFLVNVGEKLVPDVEEIAEEVVAECCGLPLAIMTIGRAMRSKDVGDVDEWRVALSDLRESTSLNMDMDMEEKVIQRLKFSYDQLRENHQKCFLYCALYPEDYKIDTRHLIEYWVMEGLVKGSSKEDEMSRGRVILNKLKGCCMLDEVSLEGRLPFEVARGLVKMHDLIRDMALYITKSKPKFMVKTGLSSAEIPHEDDWSEDLERVSFMGSRIEDISITPKCPKLLTLIFAQKYYDGPLKHVASGFFVHMKSLTVLDLSRTSIESLPDSLSDLVNLRGLLLINCEKLVRVPSLSKLQSLRVLKLTWSAIKKLPHGMEMLVNLRSLDLSFNSKLKEMIPSGFISKFSLLEELKLERIAAEYVYARERGGDFVQELSSLTHLENLTIQFHELSDFISHGEFTNFEKLKKYFIVIEDFYHESDFDPERSVCLSNSKGIPCNALRLPKNIQFLGVEHFARLSELPLNDQTDLREIRIRLCNSMEFIVPQDEESIFLPRIEKMGISCCNNLSKIYEKVPAHGAFPCLKRLDIRDCDNIKVFLSSRLLQQLLNLEVIHVWDCSQLEELVVADGDESGAIPVLPRLHYLNLQELPKLKSNWSQLFMYSNSWQEVYIDTVKLDRLFISTRLLQHFQYLEYISVSYCVELEELIVEEEEACEIDYTVALPRLKALEFWNLPKLKSIWKGVMVCDSLQRVEVHNCPELKRLPLFNREHQSAPPSLKQIYGSREWWDSLEWDYPRPEHLFQ